MQELQISAWSWDEENEAHLRERHPDIDPADVDSLLGSMWIALENTGEAPARAALLVLGVDSKNRRLVVPADPTGQEGVWRPRTAHQMSGWHERRYDEELSKGEQ